MKARFYIQTKWDSLQPGIWARVRDVTTLCHTHGRSTHFVRDVDWPSLPLAGESVQFAGHQWPTAHRKFDAHGTAHITLRDFIVYDTDQLATLITTATSEGWDVRREGTAMD